VAPRYWIGGGSAAAALAALGLTWFSWISGRGNQESVLMGLMTVGLLVAIVLTFQFPIHVRHNTKIHMNSVPLYLMVALLPPPLAATAAGLGMLTGEISVRAERGNYLSDIVTQAGRWTIIALLGSLIAHLPAGHDTADLVGAAGFLWAADILTSPLLLSPATGERPRRVILSLVRESGLVEGAEYLVGLLGALAALKETWAVFLLFLPTALVYLAFKSSKEMREGTREMLESMADTVDLRDPYTGGHSRRVADLCQRILRELPRSGPEVDLIVLAARVHDIGKIGVPDYVLNKAGALTPEESVLMKAHPERGADLLVRYPAFSRGVDIVRHHHERWDGEGYPHRLKETDIPFGARVIAVADSFDAMSLPAGDDAGSRGSPVAGRARQTVGPRHRGRHAAQHCRPTGATGSGAPARGRPG
jgi:hypothetical protein